MSISEHHTTESGASPGASAIILADLHLGSNRCKGRHLCRFLSSLLHSPSLPEEIILAGDTIDHWNLTNWQPIHFKALAHLRELGKKTSLIWLRGNHEGKLSHACALLGVPLKPSHVCQSGGNKFLICHGDKINRVTPAISSKQTAPIRDWLLGHCKFKTSKSLHETTRVVTHAILLAQKEKCAGIITGHTHTPICGIIAGVLYANPGSWLQQPTGYLRLASGQVQMIVYA